MAGEISTIIYPVKDLGSAKELYGRLLGAEPVIDQPYYVQFNVGGQQIGLDPRGHAKGMTGPVPYVPVDDIQAALTQLREAGAEERQSPNDVGGGRLVALVADSDGNLTGLMQDT
jgi:predicted enzyme related to lactoylglutathione lyase